MLPPIPVSPVGPEAVRANKVYGGKGQTQLPGKKSESMKKQNFYG